MENAELQNKNGPIFGPFLFCCGDPNIRKPKMDDRAVEVPFRMIRKRGGARKHLHSI